MTTPPPQNIFLFHGDDSYSSSKKLKSWEKAFLKKYGEDANIEIIEGKKMDVSQFETNIETVPFLCDKRFIIIKDFLANAKDEARKRITKSIEKTPDFCILVFHENKSTDKRTSLYKKLVKIGKVETFNPLSPGELTMWIQKKAKEENIKIPIVTSQYLSHYAGPELWRIASELEKLKVYANGEEVTKEMIETLVTPSLSASIFKLTDSIAQKNAKVSLTTLKTLKESGEELTKVFFMIARHFRILIQVHDMVQKGNPAHSISKKLRQPPFVIQKTSSQSKNFTSEKLVEIYKTLLQIDIATKTGLIKAYQKDDREYQLAIEKLILDCCK